MNKPAVPAKTFADLLKSDAYKGQLAAALPKGLTADRMVRVVLTAFNKTPALLRCTKESLWEAVLNCASLGLFPDALGRAYLVPYGEHCQLIIGYKGLIDLAYRSDRIGMIQLGAVFEGDEFSYCKGLRPDLKHNPTGMTSDPAKMTHVYSIVHIKGCDLASFEVMRKDEVDAIRARSKASGKGPWVTDYVPMAMKSCFRRHSRVLPMSAEYAAAVEVDADTYNLDAAVTAKPGRFSDDTAKETTAEHVETAPSEPAMNGDLG